MNHKMNQNQASDCCSSKDNCGTCCSRQTVLANQNEKHPSWIIGQINTVTGVIPRISTSYTLKDRIGSWKVRWGIGRMNNRISPGIYGVGRPDADSPVLVSANYKLSFDMLRRELAGLNLWILVLDTKGINVWCAAGKGTFGTAELVERVAQVKLNQIVSHRTLILPQLSAPGVAAHQVLKQSGFKVIYGPVRARDIPEFLKAGLKATIQMREVRFGILDRLVLTPMELVAVIKPALILFAILFGVNIIKNGSLIFGQLINRTLLDFLPYLGSILIGSVLVPILLPFIPGRAFSWKGWLLGLVWAGVYLSIINPSISWGQMAVYLLAIPPIASFLAMNFTGASTYTSLSGVVREMQFALPAQLISTGLGILVLIGVLFFK